MNDSSTSRGLIDRIAQGDVKALSSFYDLYALQVFHFSRFFINSEEICQEIVSDVFLVIWHNREKMPEIKNLPAYLYTITKNKAFDYLDKLSRIPQFTENIPFEISSSESNPQEIVQHKELEEFINNAINQLPERCKLIFLLAREGGLKYRDIARLLSISEKTVQAQMIKAMKILGGELKDYFSSSS